VRKCERATVTDQYDGPGTTPAWLAYITGEWTRNIYGISGSLDATQNDTETPVLQISNLHGDTIGTMPDSETAKITFSSEATEYGVPTITEPPPHSWLGATALRTELPSGVLDMGARSYVPQLGAFLQPDPQPGGSANAYAYTHGDPLNESDPSGEWTLNKTSGGLSAVGEGPGTGLESSGGIAAGAIIPNPPDIQAQEALASHLALDQLTAATEEVAEFELPEWLEEEAGDGGPGDMHFLTYPDDKSPDVESQCNKTGQGCSGKKVVDTAGYAEVFQ
jgi:RHS repeat-associated protein